MALLGAPVRNEVQTKILLAQKQGWHPPSWPATSDLVFDGADHPLEEGWRYVETNTVRTITPKDADEIR
jgi:hypothetical protein